MRRFLLLLFLVSLASACGTVLPTATPTPVPPTPASLKPANLQTPRPTQPTPTPVAAATPGARATSVGPPTTTPITTLRGIHVTVSEPLQGFLLDDKLYSPIIGETFQYRVYLPPDYLQAAQRHYPVLYMLHGNGGNYTEWSDSFLPEQIDRLIVANQIQPIIVVMPDDGEATYFANWDNGPRWGDYIADDVVATIDLRYRTLPTTSGRAIGGLSMGGLGALNLALQHPDVFSVVGGHSPSVRLEPDPSLWFLTGQNFWENDPIWLAQHQAGLDTLKIWLDAGSEDVWLPNIEAVHAALVEEGLHVEYHEFPGPHEAEYWIEHVPDYLRFYSAALGT
jgi:enterochelin esterase-like enzyme